MRGRKYYFFLIFMCFILSSCNDKNNNENIDSIDKYIEVPTNLVLNDSEMLSWDKVENASKYIVYINDDEYETSTNQLDCFMLLNHYGNYEISVSALREDEETEKSSILEYDLKVPKGLATRYNSAGTEVIFGVYDSSLVKGKVIIPEEVNGKPVTTLLNNAFKDCDKMTGIVLPDTIKTIGMMAFMNCANMTRCKLPEFLETIESGLFKNCISLLKIEQFNYVKTIYSDAFQGCASLKELIIPSTFTWGRGSHPLSLENCDNF